MPKFVSQQERNANLHPKIKEGLAEFKKENYQETEYQYYDDKRGIQDWDKYEATLNKEAITELIIKPNQFNFLNNKLVIKDYPNLKTLYACGIGINKIELNCPSLKNLYLADNGLKQIDFNKTPNLKHIVLSNNQIRKLRVKPLKYLEDLRCNNNYLFDLDVRGLTNLTFLDTSSCHGTFPPIRGSILQRILSLQKVKLGNNPKLEILDLAENNIDNQHFPPLPNLIMISLRGNSSYYEDIFLRSPKLSFLDYYLSNTKEVNHVLGLSNPERLRICNDDSYRDADGSYNPDVATEWEDLVYRMKQRREKEFIDGEWGFAFEDNPNKNKKTTDDEGYESDDNTINASKYKIPEKKDEIVDHDLSQWNLTGKLVIDGWVNLKSLNVGNNFLQALVVRNCPKLTILRYAHNAMPKEAEISGCDNIKRIDNYRYDEFVGKENEEVSEEEQSRAELLAKTEEYNEKVYSLLQKNEEDITFEEIHELITDFKLINPDYKEQFLTLYKIKFQKRFPELYKKQPKKQENKPDYKKLYYDLLKKIKSGEITLNNKSEITNSLLSKEKKEELYKLLANQSTNQEKQPTNHSFIISISVLSVIALALLAKILQEKIKSFLSKIIKTN